MADKYLSGLAETWVVIIQSPCLPPFFSSLDRCVFMSFYINQIPTPALEWSCVEDHAGYSADSLSVTKCCKYQRRANQCAVPGCLFESLKSRVLVKPREVSQSVQWEASGFVFFSFRTFTRISRTMTSQTPHTGSLCLTLMKPERWVCVVVTSVNSRGQHSIGNVSSSDLCLVWPLWNRFVW